MEKAILKTLIYADIFDYPLKAYEIHKWLIGRKATLRQVEKALVKLNQVSSIKHKGGFYFLTERNGLVQKRRCREKQSVRFLWKAQVVGWFLQLIPWIKLVGVSGGLAMDNADKGDDIDLILITAKNRLWLSRILIIGFLDFMGVRRKPKMKDTKIGGKLCTNILLEEDKLEQDSKDIYLAHEVLQMRVLWQRNGIYGKYLSDNEWAFKFLPNWVGPDTSLRGASHRGGPHSKSGDWQSLLIKIPKVAFGDLGMTLEWMAKWFQLKLMKKPQGMERIEDGALYFHPNDIRPKILKSYREKLAPLDPSVNSGSRTDFISP